MRFLIALVLTFAVLGIVAANSDIVDGIQSEINSIVKDINQVESHMKAVIAEIEKLRNTEGDSVVDKITSILKSTQPDSNKKTELTTFLKQHIVSKYGYDPTSVRQEFDFQPRILGILDPLFGGILGCNGLISGLLEYCRPRPQYPQYPYYPQYPQYPYYPYYPQYPQYQYPQYQQYNQNQGITPRSMYRRGYKAVEQSPAIWEHPPTDA
eukprot:gene6589-7647_t